MIINNDLQDHTLERLGNYISTELNNRLPIKYKEQGYKVVNTFYPIKVPNISLTEYPILIIYRLSKSVKRINTKVKSMFRLIYIISYPDYKLVAGYINWIADNLAEILLTYEQRSNNPAFKDLSFMDDRIEFNNEFSSGNLFTGLSMILTIQE